MVFINSFVIKKSIISKAGFQPFSSFLHTIVLPKSAFPFSAFALSNYMFVQFWYRDEKKHTVKVTINNQSKDNEQEIGSYNLPAREEDKNIFQNTLLLPKIVVSAPQTIWLSTYCNGKKVQDYPIEFLCK